MSNSKKSQLWKVAVAMILTLSMVLTACGPTPEPVTVVETDEVEKTVVETVVERCIE